MKNYVAFDYRQNFERRMLKSAVELSLLPLGRGPDCVNADLKIFIYTATTIEHGLTTWRRMLRPKTHELIAFGKIAFRRLIRVVQE